MKTSDVQIGQTVVAIKMPNKFRQYYSAPIEGVVINVTRNTKGKPLVDVRFSNENFVYNSILLKPALLKLV